MENNMCVGGLRNPNKAVAKNVALRKVGVRLRIVLERVVREMPQVMSVGDPAAPSTSMMTP